MSRIASAAAMFAASALMQMSDSFALAGEGYPQGVEPIECCTPDLEVLHYAALVDHRVSSDNAEAVADFLVVSNLRSGGNPHLILAIRMTTTDWNEDCAIRISQVMDFSGMQQQYAEANPDAQVPLPQLTLFRHVFIQQETGSYAGSKTFCRRPDLESALNGMICLELCFDGSKGWHWDSAIWPCLFHAKSLSIELISPQSVRKELLIDKQAAGTLLEFYAEQAGIAINYQALHDYYLWDSKQGHFAK
ncbi:hypothetical protein KDL44_08605 [bacterium]|nr:hypothetical protein [bacterium]